VIDRAYLARHGAVAIRAEPGAFVVANARRAGAASPWRPAPRKDSAPSPAASQPAPESSSDLSPEGADATVDIPAEPLQ
ncbi:competence protein ComEC, partial [Methylobacterium trifolii]